MSVLISSLTDEIKKEYTELVKLNQKLKLISSCYYISYSGMVYVKTLVNFTDVIVELKKPEVFHYMRGVMILPNKFFAFTKKAKKTKLDFSSGYNKETDTMTYYFGQMDDPELTCELSVVNINEENDEMYVRENIIPKMYKKLFILKDMEEYRLEENPSANILTDEEVQCIIDGHPLYSTTEELPSLITKHLCLDLKKGDLLQIYKHGELPIYGKCKKVYYIIAHSTDIYTSYTLLTDLKY